MKALARYGLADAGAPGTPDAVGRAEGAARDPHASSSPATTCCCSTSRPTTSTSTPPWRSSGRSTGSIGTVVAVSHDRTFLRTCDRFVLIDDDGEVWSLPDYDLAMDALAAPGDAAGRLRHGRP